MMETYFRATGFKFTGEGMLPSEYDEHWAKLKTLSDKMPKTGVFEIYRKPSIRIEKAYKEHRLVSMELKSNNEMQIYLFDNSDKADSGKFHHKEMILHILYRNREEDFAVSIWIPLKSSGKGIDDEITNYIKMVKKCLDTDK